MHSGVRFEDEKTHAIIIIITIILPNIIIIIITITITVSTACLLTVVGGRPSARSRSCVGDLLLAHGRTWATFSTFSQPLTLTLSLSR